MSRVFTQAFVVVGAVIEREGKVLLVQEIRKNGIDDGKWNQPAGWVEVGEDPLEAVRREVAEETGLSFEPRHVLGLYSLVRRDIEKELGATPHCLKIIFIGDASGAVSPRGDDVSAAKWFTPHEVFAMDEQTLRDLDIKQEVKDYFAGKKFSLDILTHTIAR
jgi:phosphatase NudJ